jgi:thiamine-monophosphate kinase
MKMKVKDLGEKNAINMFIESLGETADDYLGDDSAIVPIGKRYLLLTQDMITRRTHIPDEMLPEQVGWFSGAINLSDLAAMGGKPFALNLALGLPPDTEANFLKEFGTGVKKLAKTFGVRILGGDTKENSELTISGVAVGMVKKEEIMLRKGSRVGDVVAVTGDLGKAGAGLIALRERLKEKLEFGKGLMEPWPRVREGRELAKTGGVTSAIDLSDGLAYSLHILSRLNRVGFDIDEGSLPSSKNLIEVSNILEEPGMEKKCKLYFGGDYELLVTIKKEMFERAYNAVKSVGGNLTRIGEVASSHKVKLKTESGEEEIEDRGYEHFRN